MLVAGDTTLAMNVVARAAGVGVGTVYRHFPTRQALLEDLAARSLERLLAQAEAVRDDPDASRALATLLRTALACLLDDVGLGAVLRSDDIARQKTSKQLDQLLVAFEVLLERAREAGAIHPAISPDDLRRYLLGLETAVRLGDGDPQRVERDLTVLIGGLRLPWTPDGGQ